MEKIYTNQKRVGKMSKASNLQIFIPDQVREDVTLNLIQGSNLQMDNHAGLPLLLLLFAFCLLLPVKSQQSVPVILTLEQTITLATDSSLEAFRSKNVYQSSYWEYIAFKAGRLPSLTLNLTPVQYYKQLSKRYDFNDNIDTYRQQASYEANGGFSLNQNFDLLGGSFFLNSDLRYIRNFGVTTYNEFVSVPFTFGYRQNLFGYNPFKWEKKIAPLKYEKAGKQLVYDMENTASLAVSYFFNLAMAQAEYDLAQENMRNTDTLYRIGEERFKIASISQTDLLMLKLDRVNAVNSLKNAEINHKRAAFALASFLNMDKNTLIEIRLPGYPKSMEVSVDKAITEARNNNPELLGYRQNILEREQAVERTKKESMFDASVYASIGFNQVGSSFSNAYKDPTRQDILSLTLSIPLVDWGVRKGRYNMAKNTLNVIQITAKQGELKMEEDVIMTVGDFNKRKDMIKSAEEAFEIAEMAYAQTRQRFMIGKADINYLTLFRQRQQESRRNYILALENYWISYYKIRKLTLYDFEYNVPIFYTN
jgi:outer membrane protein TolC